MEASSGAQKREDTNIINRLLTARALCLGALPRVRSRAGSIANAARNLGDRRMEWAYGAEIWRGAQDQRPGLSGRAEGRGYGDSLAHEAVTRNVRPIFDRCHA